MSCFFSSRRRHTRLQGDWSSDVCSSDLAQCFEESNVNWHPNASTNWFFLNSQERYWNDHLQSYGYVFLNDVLHSLGQIGRASCRERVEVDVGAGTVG